MPALPLTILWLRQDLRLADNPALLWAVQRGAVLPIYILDEQDQWPLGAASRWFLHHALASLTHEFAAYNVPLFLRRGDPQTIIPDLVQTLGATAVTWNRCYEPYAIARDTAIKAKLRETGILVSTHNASLLYEPWQVRTKTDTPFRVFTPFYRACLALQPDHTALETPTTITAAQPSCASDSLSDSLDEWQLLPHAPDWAGGLRATWDVSSKGAQNLLTDFMAHQLHDYQTARNIPGISGTSRLSPYLHFGLMGPRQIWQQISTAMKDMSGQQPAGLLGGGEHYLRELGWREFSYHLLFHNQDLPHEPLQPAFKAFPWREAPDELRAWQRGMTGFPIVDAGMRELWQTGWMHNRVRMIVASFLIKDLLLPWQAGADWFWDTLVDADLANNAASWQWVAGCGADAAPYYRVFNPLLQSQKFDGAGDYIRRYVPELRALPEAYIHAPLTAPPMILQAAGVRLGKSYPLPMVDHHEAKTRALAALATIKKDA